MMQEKANRLMYFTGKLPWSKNKQTDIICITIHYISHSNRTIIE